MNTRHISQVAIAALVIIIAIACDTKMQPSAPSGIAPVGSVTPILDHNNVSDRHADDWTLNKCYTTGSVRDGWKPTSCGRPHIPPDDEDETTPPRSPKNPRWSPQCCFVGQLDIGYGTVQYFHKITQNTVGTDPWYTQDAFGPEDPCPLYWSGHHASGFHDVNTSGDTYQPEIDVLICVQ